MTLDEAMRVFDLSANRTRPNQQTQAWEVIRAAMIDLLALQDRVDGAEETACGDCDDGVFNGQPCEYCGGAGKFKLVPEAGGGGG